MESALGHHSLRFDRFQLHPSKRVLLDGEAPLRLGSRSFDLLVALCAQPGEIISTRDLMAAAWPNRVVEEGSVRVQIAALRKALGDGQEGRRYIANVPLRGYCFVAPVDHANSQAETAAPPPTPMPPIEAAARTAARPWPGLPRLVGRDQDCTELTECVRQRRCVTLVGPGGMGKTCVALSVAHQLGDDDGYEVVLVELAPLSSPERVPMAIASALGIVATASDAMAAITAVLGGRSKLLLVLDNCEHVIDAVAAAAEQILDHAPGVHVLATSREVLRIQNEWVQRLRPLAAPGHGASVSKDEALQFSAVQLFVERAMAGDSSLELGEAEAAQICDICRSLDGIPLAIELAAAAVDTVGLTGLVDRLGSRLALLGRGRRTALPRHQTLQATLDWSHDLLTLDERELLACLSVFRGPFNHAGARAVFARPLPLLDTALAGLVGKSLVVTERLGTGVYYRLLETTREYAAERLVDSARASDAARGHAEFLHALFKQVERERGELPPAAWAFAHARWVDDVRDAVHWALASQSHAHVGCALLAWSAPLWFSLSMLSEYRELAEKALELVQTGRVSQVDTEEHMRLWEALGHALWHTRGGGPAMNAAFTRAFALAEELHVPAYRLRCLWGLWLVCNITGDYEGSRRMAERFGDIAGVAGDPASRVTHERMMSLGLHFQGDQGPARAFAQRVLDHPPAPRNTRQSGFQFDRRVAGLTVMSRILWLQGRPDQAIAVAEEAVAEALRVDHALSLCYAIGIGAAPVAFWVGDGPKARAWTSLLRQRSRERSLHFWQAYADAYCHLVDLEDGVTPLCEEASRPIGADAFLRESVGTVRPSLVDASLLARLERGESGWCAAEMWRLLGERQAGAGEHAAASSSFQRGIDVARQQQALSWELRCAMSLGRLQHRSGRTEQARDIVEQVLSRFEEGFATRDLVLARQMLDNELR